MQPRSHVRVDIKVHGVRGEFSSWSCSRLSFDSTQSEVAVAVETATLTSGLSHIEYGRRYILFAAMLLYLCGSRSAPRVTQHAPGMIYGLRRPPCFASGPKALTDRNMCAHYFPALLTFRFPCPALVFPCPALVFSCPALVFSSGAFFSPPASCNITTCLLWCHRLTLRLSKPRTSSTWARTPEKSG